jgi:hypothetical protein
MGILPARHLELVRRDAWEGQQEEGQRDAGRSIAAMMRGWRVDRVRSELATALKPVQPSLSLHWFLCAAAGTGLAVDVIIAGLREKGFIRLLRG